MWEDVVLAFIFGEIIGWAWKKWDYENKECPTCHGKGTVKKR